MSVEIDDAIQGEKIASPWASGQGVVET